MKQVKVNVGNKSYICDLLESEEDRRKGLMGVENLPPDRGALFAWEDEGTREMWMKDTKIPLDDSEDYDKYVMKVLAPNGNTQMYLQGGERIVSRKETRTLIRKAKKAYENKTKDYNRYCKSLGKYIFKVIKGQDSRPPEYVEVPSGKDDNSNDKN